MTISLDGIAPLAERYQGFIVDLWGVIHDGLAPYPGALEALSRLKQAGKRIVLLSNAPRRAASAAAALRGLGVGDDLYDGIVTSGEVTYDLLVTRHDPFFAALGRRVYHLGPERDRNLLEGSGLDPVSSPAQAEFCLNTGPDDHRDPTSLEPFEAELAACLAAGLPMVCANPDMKVIKGGVAILCAGALARRYTEIGGIVRSVGKPDATVYEPVMAALGCERGNAVAIGDSLATDMAGARAAGLDACWVLGGIHWQEVAAHSDSLHEGAVSILEQAEHAPRYMTARFNW
ncbi:TIGR01459 family HAD-type hydrolase [Granulibacter bethesdensis]|uniref:TIGR01459 family HAD-type hydrolase n=1 Tax=Granulibacter bethesdensis TaxID=364410 RepID=UPI0003F1E1B3|nr:TIGR01459 family HAD-type hydrolase [Granulibacter bethesdensis]AHJ65662.1 Hydrolase (HAD superfamily) [Granulibacter bethesdensis CGDNIH4]